MDLRFADMRGVQHHVTFPAHAIDAGTFGDGKMFDGSSIAGWKGINESDMVLLPDADTAFIDPSSRTRLWPWCATLLEQHHAEPTRATRVPSPSVPRPSSNPPAWPTPPSSAPETEFFIFDSVRWQRRHGAKCSTRSESGEGGLWSSKYRYGEGNSGYRPGVKGRHFPLPPVDSFQDLRGECAGCWSSASTWKCTTAVANASQCEIGTR